MRDRASREPFSPFNTTAPEMKKLRNRLLADGLFIYIHWHTILIIPPLIITEEELAAGMALIDSALEEIDRVVKS